MRPAKDRIFCVFTSEDLPEKALESEQKLGVLKGIKTKKGSPL